MTSIHYCIENAFGICKDQFRLLLHPLKCAKEDIRCAIPLITSIFVLHKFLIDERDRTPIEPVKMEEKDEEDVQNNGVEYNDEFETKEILLRHM